MSKQLPIGLRIAILEDEMKGIIEHSLWTVDKFSPSIGSWWIIDVWGLPAGQPTGRVLLLSMSLWLFWMANIVAAAQIKEFTVDG